MLAAHLFTTLGIQYVNILAQLQSCVSKIKQNICFSPSSCLHILSNRVLLATLQRCYLFLITSEQLKECFVNEKSLSEQKKNFSAVTDWSDVLLPLVGVTKKPRLISRLITTYFNTTWNGVFTSGSWVRFTLFITVVWFDNFSFQESSVNESINHTIDFYSNQPVSLLENTTYGCYHLIGCQNVKYGLKTDSLVNLLKEIVNLLKEIHLTLSMKSCFHFPVDHCHCCPGNLDPAFLWIFAMFLR